jgi:zinc/manganese transport system permease protein
VRALSIVFLLVVALAASASTLVVGVLLSVSLLIAPAAAAVQLTRRPVHSLLLSLVFALSVTWGGLLVSFVGTWRHPPIGFSISTLSALVYLAAVIRGRRGRPKGVRELRDLDREVRGNERQP